MFVVGLVDPSHLPQDPHKCKTLGRGIYPNYPRGLSQAQVFHPLPALQLLDPCHLPGHGAIATKVTNRHRQQDCTTLKIKLSYKQPEVSFLNLLQVWILHCSPKQSCFTVGPPKPKQSDLMKKISSSATR